MKCCLTFAQLPLPDALMLEFGTFSYADEQIPQAELNALFESGL